MLKQKYQISEDDFIGILKLIIGIETNKAVPVENPTVIILGAQPGAGKTELQKEAELRLLKNAVICNADNFRDYHPLADVIKRDHPDEYPDITSEYSLRWNVELCRYCMDHKLNYILETTFRSGNHVNDTISELKENGYRTDIMLLAVDPRISRLGISLRYEYMVKNTGAGRKVSIQDHNLRFNAIQDTIQQVQRARLFGNFFIYTRTIVLQGVKNIDGVTLVAENPADPLTAFKEELQRSWPEKATLDFEHRCNVVLGLMKERNASRQEIKNFRQSVDVDKSNKQKRGKRL